MNFTKNFLLKKREKLLKIGITHSFGRNFLGRTTVFGKGMLNKMRFYLINFKYYISFSGIVLDKLVDYYRNAFIGLVLYNNGFLTYLLLEDSIKVGDTLPSLILNTFLNMNNFAKGHSYYIKNIPLNFKIFGVEKYPLKGMVYSRSAGTFVTIISKEKNWVYLKLKSGWKIKLLGSCIGTIGVSSNIEYHNIILGKAGFSRYLGKRPKVRGVAMNPCDHPHGGGEGKSSGKCAARTPWGKLTKTYPTIRSKKRKLLKYGSF